MTIIPISLPPGLFMNGTDYEAKGRYCNGNRVRWQDSALQPIGGWEALTNYAGVPLDPLTLLPDTITFRDGASWVDNGGSRHTVFGSNAGLSVLQPDTTAIDVTPVDFVGSPNNPTVNVGYGKWLYGRSSYGSPRPVNPADTAALWRWCFDTWGEDLLAGANDPKYRGALYSYDVTNPTDPFVLIPEAPQDHNGFVVTDERIVMTIGSNNEARLVRWCDRENYTEWTPDVTNWAGFQALQGTGRLIAIVKVLSQNLIISESDAHVARFVGSPYIYGFDRVGQGCGPWNGQCIVVTDRFAMWPGRRTFWMYDGSLRQVPCDLMTFLERDLNGAMIAKAHSMEVPQYSELWWCYQSHSSDEVDSYIAFDYVEQIWTKGKLDRTCSIDGEVYVNPKMVDAMGMVYEHEKKGTTVDDAWALTGPLELGGGESNLAVSRIFPDTANFGDVTFQLFGRQMPTEVDVESPVYVYNNPTNIRFLAREIRIRYDGLARDWRVGTKMRMDVVPTGTGKR